MEFFWASIRKDLKRWRQDYTAILLWLSIPLMIGGLITAMMDGDGTEPTVVIDQFVQLWPGETCGNPGATSRFRLQTEGNFRCSRTATVFEPRRGRVKTFLLPLRARSAR